MTVLFFLYRQINHVGVWLRRKGISYKFTGPKYKGRQFRATMRTTVRGDPNTPTPRGFIQIIHYGVP